MKYTRDENYTLSNMFVSDLAFNHESIVIEIRKDLFGKSDSFYDACSDFCDLVNSLNSQFDFTPQEIANDFLNRM